MYRARGYWVAAGWVADPPTVSEPLRSADLHPVLDARAEGARLEPDRRVHRLCRVWQRWLLRARGLHHRAADAFQVAGAVLSGSLLRRHLVGAGRGADRPTHPSP